MRVNPFGMILFLMHKVSFCWTPIHLDRYLAQHEEEDRSRSLAGESRRASKSKPYEIDLSLQQRHMSEPIFKISTKDAHTGDQNNNDGEYYYDDDMDEGNFAHRRQIDDGARPWRYFVLHPVQLIQLVKQYHLAGNLFLIGTLVHFATIIHLVVKSIVMVVAERSNHVGGSKKVHEYYKSPYYPYMVGALSEPYSMNNCYLAMLVFCLCSRTLSLSRLVRGSLVNQIRYRRIWITQVNLVVLTFLSLTPAGWRAFFRQAASHAKALERGQKEGADEKDVHELRGHLHLDDSIAPKLDSCSMHELLYQSNTIEFGRCYGDIKFLTIEQRSEGQRLWFANLPRFRICVCTLRLVIICSVVGSLLIIGLANLFFVTILLIEIRSSAPQNTTAFESTSYQSPGMYDGIFGWVTTLLQHFKNPVHLIRSIELYIFLLLNIPNHIDGVATYADLVVTIGRANKLIKLFDYESKLSQHVGGSGGDQVYSSLFEQTLFEDVNKSSESFPPRKVSLRVKQAQHFNEYKRAHSHKSKSIVTFVDPQAANKRSPLDWSGLEVEKTNNRVLHLTKLSNLLYYEFIDLRSRHSLYLNLLFVGNGISVSYMLTLLSVKDPLEFLLFSIALLSSLVPVLVVLVICAVLERRFKTLYITMVQLMDNRDQKLEYRTLERLRVASRLYEKKGGRAMLIFGKYAITQDSMTPLTHKHTTSTSHQIIAYMATAILYLH